VLRRCPRARIFFDPAGKNRSGARGNTFTCKISTPAGPISASFLCSRSFSSIFGLALCAAQNKERPELPRPLLTLRTRADLGADHGLITFSIRDCSRPHAGLPELDDPAGKLAKFLRNAIGVHPCESTPMPHVFFIAFCALRLGASAAAVGSTCSSTSHRLFGFVHSDAQAAPMRVCRSRLGKKNRAFDDELRRRLRPLCTKSVANGKHTTGCPPTGALGPLSSGPRVIPRAPCFATRPPDGRLGRALPAPRSMTAIAQAGPIALSRTNERTFFNMALCITAKTSADKSSAARWFATNKKNAVKVSRANCVSAPKRNVGLPGAISRASSKAPSAPFPPSAIASWDLAHAPKSPEFLTEPLFSF